MRLIIKLACFLLVLGVGGLFFIKKPDGTPWLSLDDFTPNVSLDTVRSTIDDVMPDQIVSGGDTVTVYRWQDAAGNWQYSDTPPPDSQTEQVLIDTNLNRDLVPGFSPSQEMGEKPSGRKAYLIKDSSKPSSINIADPKQVTKLINDAKNVQKLMDDRDKQLQEVLSPSTN